MYNVQQKLHFPKAVGKHSFICLCYLKRMIIIMFDPKARKKPYQMRNDDPYRICVLTSQEQKKKGEANENERKKGSR